MFILAVLVKTSQITYYCTFIQWVSFFGMLTRYLFLGGLYKKTFVRFALSLKKRRCKNIKMRTSMFAIRFRACSVASSFTHSLLAHLCPTRRVKIVCCCCRRTSIVINTSCTTLINRHIQYKSTCRSITTLPKFKVIYIAT